MRVVVRDVLVVLVLFVYRVVPLCVVEVVVHVVVAVVQVLRHAGVGGQEGNLEGTIMKTFAH